MAESMPPLLYQARAEGVLHTLEDSFLDRNRELKAALILEGKTKADFLRPRLPRLFSLVIEAFPLQQFNGRWFHKINDWWFYLSLERDGELVNQQDPKYCRLHRRFYMQDVRSNEEAVRQLEEAAAFLERWYPLNHRPKVYQNGKVVSAK